MSEKLYLNDMYLEEFDAIVTRTDGNKIYLDRTAFYPVGGGQPNDTGTLTSNGSSVSIIDVRKDDHGDIFHVSAEAHALGDGDRIHGSIDWDKRYAYMRYHTTLHLLNGVAANLYGKISLITGSQIHSDRSRVDFDIPGLNKDGAQRIIEQANVEAAAGRRVIIREVAKDEALAMPNLVRSEPGMELVNTLDSVRVVEIEGLDIQTCGGLHVHNSKEIGRILFDGFKNNGSHNKRLEIRLE